jgi:hypothetical protein
LLFRIAAVAASGRHARHPHLQPLLALAKFRRVFDRQCRLCHFERRGVIALATLIMYRELAERAHAVSIAGGGQIREHRECAIRPPTPFLDPANIPKRAE